MNLGQNAPLLAREGELEAVVDGLISDFVAKNSAAQLLKARLDEVGVGFKSVVDHITIRTLDVDRRAEDFIRLGYRCDETLEYDDWFAKVYRAPGYPALFVDQAWPGARGATSIIPRWVAKFGDETLHHVAVRVDDIERAIRRLKAQGVLFAGQIVGEKGGMLRQIFTIPEEVDGEPFSVLELTERHRGFQGFSPPQADGLMKSTVRPVRTG
jgi:catechol 2,3-dioxygenase-like lactoylglutathione lyase family enzyme